MKTIWNACYNFLNRDINTSANANDSKDLAVLLRILSIIYATYYFLLFTIIYGFRTPSLAFWPFFSSVCMILIFLSTYKFGTRIPNTLFYVGIISFTYILCILLGTVFGLRYSIVVLIPLAFFNITWSLPEKFIRSFVYAGIMISLDIISWYFPTTTSQISGEKVCIMETSLLAFIASLIVLSYFFCQKFTQAEHQVYIYNKKLKKMASLDPLTCLMNRRGMYDSLKEIEQEYHNGKANLSIAIGDIDFFKNVNDCYGHDCGDYILTMLASLFKKYMDGNGEVCRWGGEEFLFIFNRENSDQIFVLLNDLRHAIKHTQFVFNDQLIAITMTFGLEEYNPHASIEETIKKADEKLYLGKESGRDKVVY